MTSPRRSLPWAAASAAAIALLSSAACGPAKERPRHVVLVSIDTLRADHLGCYGYDRGTSPGIDRLAGEGTLFEQACATASWTLPAHASILTGLYPRSHGVDGWQVALPVDLPTLPAQLAAEGYATAAFVNVAILSAQRGFDRGFETWSNLRQSRTPAGETDRVIDAALDWLAKRDDRPVFLFLHFYDAHSDYAALPDYQRRFVRPYSGPANGTTDQLNEYREGRLPPWGSDEARHLSDLYDAGICQLDAQLERLWDGLRAEGLWSETLLVLTSDHGEEFLEHGGVLHDSTLHEEQIRVPLIFVGPGVPRGARVREAVSQVDIMPTVLGLLGIAGPRSEGVDLSRAWGQPESRPIERSIFAEADKWYAMGEPNARRSVRRGRYTLHYDQLSGTKRLFDISADPGEQTDLAAERPEVVESLWVELQGFMDSSREVGESFELSEQELSTLRELGYF
jgi:arylsulfatase A-like enzyme